MICPATTTQPAGGFGRPEEIRAGCLEVLPVQMQWEAIALLREMGLTRTQVAAHLGIPRAYLQRIEHAEFSPHRRDGELVQPAEEE